MIFGVGCEQKVVGQYEKGNSLVCETKTFITEIQKEDGAYEGPEISASSWEDAQRQAEEQGAILVGELA